MRNLNNKKSETEINGKIMSDQPFKRQPHKILNTLKQFIGKLPINSLSVFDHFVGLALKGLTHFTSVFHSSTTWKYQKIVGERLQRKGCNLWIDCTLTFVNL